MTTEQLKAITLEGYERMFNQGDLDYIDQAVAPGAVDHQEPDGTDFVAHLKDVVTTCARRSLTCPSMCTRSSSTETSWRAARP